MKENYFRKEWIKNIIDCSGFILGMYYSPITNTLIIGGKKCYSKEIREIFLIFFHKDLKIPVGGGNGKVRYEAHRVSRKRYAAGVSEMEAQSYLFEQVYKMGRIMR